MALRNPATNFPLGGISAISPFALATALLVVSLIRELIVDVYPDVVEVAWPKQGTIGYGVGPKKMSEHFCYIDAHRNHVNLGFNYGADLPDPDHLLEGPGKRFRHIKIQGTEDGKRPALRRLLEAAVEERKKILEL